MTPRPTALVTSAILLAATAGSGDAQPVGDEFQVNTVTLADQWAPAVASAPGGRFVVVWESYSSSGSDSSLTSVQAQRFGADGSPLGDQFQVNTTTSRHQQYPAVAMADDGAFVVVWSHRPESSVFSYRVRAQRFAPDGSFRGSEIELGSRVQMTADVGLDPLGNFVVVWSAYDGSAGPLDWANFGQRFAADGSPLGTVFQVESTTPFAQYLPAVDVDADGSFVVAWASLVPAMGPDPETTSIMGQLFGADGATVGGEILLRTAETGGSLYRPDVAFGADGDFLVVWDGECATCTDSDGAGIRGRRATAGAPLGESFQINDFTTGWQSRPRVGSGGDGPWVVTWESSGSPGSDSSSVSIQSHRISSTGSRLGDELQVNTYTAGAQIEPALAVSGSGDLVVVWASEGSAGTDASGFGIQGQRSLLPIFEDGFESGDTTAW